MPYQNIQYALKLCEYTQALLPEFPIQYLRCLILISYNEGISITSISQKMNIPISTASRIVGALENKRQYGKAYQFACINLNPSNKRQRIITLSSKGRDFLQQLDNAME